MARLSASAIAADLGARAIVVEDEDFAGTNQRTPEPPIGVAMAAHMKR